MKKSIRPTKPRTEMNNPEQIPTTSTAASNPKPPENPPTPPVDAGTITASAAPSSIKINSPVADVIAEELRVAGAKITVLSNDLATLKRQHAKIEEQNRLMLATLRWYTDAHETNAIPIDAGKRAKQAFDWVTADNKKKA